MSRNVLHDWEPALEKAENIKEKLDIALDIYNTAYRRGRKDVADMQIAIDKLQKIANEIDYDHRGKLYYAILDLSNKYGTHDSGDYFIEGGDKE